MRNLSPAIDGVRTYLQTAVQHPRPRRALWVTSQVLLENAQDAVPRRAAEVRQLALHDVALVELVLDRRCAVEGRHLQVIDG